MIRRAALALVVCLVGPPLLNVSVAFAQDRPVVFVHGLASHGRTWDDAVKRLGDELQIEPHAPDLPWFAAYETQANELQNQLGFLDNSTIAIGHSNGGLVSRQWSRQHPLSGIITVGTPHWGAPLVVNAPWMYDFISRLEGTIDELWDRLAYQCCDWTWFLREVLDYALTGGSLVSGATWGAIGNILAGSPIVLDEMVPGSAFHGDINGGWNIAHEFAEVGPRVGIVSVADAYWYGGPMRLMGGFGETTLLVRDVTVYLLTSAALTIEVFDADDGGYWDRLGDNLWRAIDLLTWIDYRWCQMVFEAPVYGFWGCGDNDMVVPTWSQDYRSLGAIGIGINGPMHTQETRDDQVIGWAGYSLANFMGATPRPPVLPPPSGSGGPVTMGPDSFLWPGQWALSEDQRFGLTYADDRVALFNWEAQVLWQISTDGRSSGHIHLQDGDLVVYDGDGVPIWSSGSGGHPGAYLSVQNDGNMVIYDTNGALLWATNTNWY